MDTQLIKFFGVALKEDDSSKMSFSAMNKFAMQRGYIVHPDVCNESVYAFLGDITINPNSTFYKTWKDITSKTRFELLIDQLLHYATTYGTDYSLGNGYVPNDNDYKDVPAFKNFKVILPISVEELSQKCMGVLQSGIALDESTMNSLAEFVCDNMDKNDIDVDSIKNREALVYICSRFNLYPKDPVNLFRYIIYVTTGKTMIVKNKEMFYQIAASETPFDFSILDDETMKSLSSIFLRFKELFCAFKHNENLNNSKEINKLRRLAVKYHKPMKPAFWQNVFSIKATPEELAKHSLDLTNFKKVAIMQTCLERLHPLNNQFYLIRNQKTWVRENYVPKAEPSYIMLIYATLYKSLVESLKKNSYNVTTDEDGNEIRTPKVVKTVSGVNIPLPTSEKSFIGNYPFGTSYKFTENNYFGVYWRNEWGTRDYDLSLIDIDNHKIGWNSNFYTDNNDVVFSGDMTNANPEATEMLYIKKGCPTGIINVNQFNGDSKSKFRLFFGQEKITNLTRNYMVDPNTIKLNVEIKHENQRQITCGVTNGDSLVLMSVNCGGGAVSYGSRYSSMMIQSILHKSTCFVNSEEILKEAGFNVVGEDSKETPDIDFANLNKDSLISIMA